MAGWIGYAWKGLPAVFDPPPQREGGLRSWLDARPKTEEISIEKFWGYADLTSWVRARTNEFQYGDRLNWAAILLSALRGETVEGPALWMPSGNLFILAIYTYWEDSVVNPCEVLNQEGSDREAPVNFRASAIKSTEA